MPEINKKAPAEGYPPEDGCYLRGNDCSPVAVAVILRWKREETPREIENLVRLAIETGAALAGTVQTENIGVEKIVCNVVANPNIRYLVVCGPESEGHLVGGAIMALSQNGVDNNRRIIEAEARTPYLFNIPLEFIDRFRKQVTIIDLINEGQPDLIRQAVTCCYQEKSTPFRGYSLWDPGAYPDPPLCGKITWRVTHPQLEPKSEEERSQVSSLKVMMNRIKQSVEAKRRSPSQNHAGP